MIQCPSCGETNVEGARFCAHCGTGLGDHCPACGSALPGEVAFCPSCGTNLQDSPTQERRFITVLFVDLVGFTAESDEADPEDVHARLVPYHDRVRHEIESYGGTVEKLIGDGVMAVFGAPTAHEDDPERAVRAALRIQNGVEELNEERTDLTFQVRIGINTGEAMVTTGGGGERIVGDVVNTASRLESIAPPGGVVVGEATHRATQLFIEYEDMDPVEVKGKAKPLQIWRAIEPRGRYGIDAAFKSDTPFLGRDSEMGLLQETFRRVLDDRTLQLVTVAAPPGVGKSRLVNEFWQWADDQPEIVWWRQGRCLPYGEGITFWALGEIVKGQAGIRETDDTETASEKLAIALEAICDDLSTREWLKTQLSPLVGIGSESEGGDRSEAFAAWRRFLEDLSSLQPLVMVIEDLHWVDDAFMEFLEDLLVWSTDVPIMVICTARPELYEKHPSWGGGHRNSSTITLAPLNDENISRLIASHLNKAVLPAETQRALLERAEGNPLYAEEFIRMLTDRGMLTAQGELQASESIPVPETVQGLIGSRLDVLSEAEARAIEDAAVVGKVFWEGSISALGDHEGLRTSLRGLVARDWIRPVRNSAMEGEAEYAFWHALTRDVAYGRIPRRARAEKHRLMADWIEQAAGERAEDHAELLAHHYQSALEIAEAVGGSDLETLRESALRAFAMAGDRARHLDPARAAAFYDKALELMTPDDSRRAETLVKAGEVHFDLGRSNTRVDELFSTAAGLAEKQGNNLIAGRAWRRLHLAHWFAQGTGAGTEELDRGIALLEALPPSQELSDSYTTRAGHYMMQGDLENQLLWAEKAIEIDQQLENPSSRGHSIRGIARFHGGDIEAGMEDLRLAVEISKRTQLPNIHTATAYVNLADHTWLQDGPRPAVDIYRTGIDLLEARGADMSWSHAELMWAYFDLGEWDELIGEADSLLERWDAQEVQFIPWAQSQKARVLSWRGDVGQASSLIEAALPRLREIEDLQLLTPALVIGARVRLQRGDGEAVVALLDEFYEITRDKSPLYRTWEINEVVRLLIEVGDLERVRKWLSSPPAPGGLSFLAMRTAETALMEAEGDFESALSGYRSLASEWENFGDVPETALASYGAGRCSVELGLDATEAWAKARAIFDDLGAEPTVAEIDGLSDRAASL
ncbi:MAG: adenylate/guanylate cyclase domain-containing protein [Acidimicrobiia bacterium]|nr:adenylate/guanylate cyclase domain-containing protein [Acidimicrobiia bacterium]